MGRKFILYSGKCNDVVSFENLLQKKQGFKNDNTVLKLYGILKQSIRLFRKYMKQKTTLLGVKYKKVF